jgi:nucleotide-binding universal stress UspA family protein
MKLRSILDETDWMENLTKENDDIMKKIIVPVDFSDTSKNAARYAAAFSADIEESEVLLYHVYDNFSFGSDGSPLQNDQDTQKVIANSALHNLRSEILPLTKSTIGILSEPGSLAENLEKLVLHNGADIVIMGISGASRLEQVLIGSNTLKVIKKENFPVLIVPPDAQYKRIKKMAFASDFKDVESNVPVNSLRHMLSIFRPELHVIHVDEDRQAHLGAAFKKEKDAMEYLLQGFNPEYHFLSAGIDFTRVISNYVVEQDMDLIITVPKRHSFLADLFTQTHTEKLVYHTHIPVLAIHQ